MNDKIILYPSNWLYNAGVVGFLRILEFAGKGDTFEFKDDGSVEIQKVALDNFEICYFEYVSKLYLIQRFSLKELTSFVKNLKNKGSEEEKNEIGKVESKVKESENEIQNKILSVNANKDWNGFAKMIYEIQNTLSQKINEIKEELKNILKKETDKKIEQNINKIEKNFKKVFNSIFEFKAQADFLGNFYFNKSEVANPKGRRLERSQKFKEKYLLPVIGSKSGDILCIFCGNRYSEENISELAEGDFSILGISSKKFANFYNYYSKNGISYNRKCSLCQLILLCAFAGFNLKPFSLRELDETDYIFVNYPSFKEAFNVNNKIQEEFKNYQFGTMGEKINTYMKSLELILTISEKKTRWLLENTYFAEIKTSPNKKEGKPKFVYFNIDKAFAEVFNEFDIGKLFKDLSFWYEVYKNNRVYLSTEILKRLLEKKPLIYIAFKMFSEKIRDKDTYMLPIWSIILLEFLINQKRRLNMDAKKSYGILKSIQEEGRRSFSLEEIDKDKRFHISQRFLTLIRGARKEDFYNELLRLFVVYEKPVPETLFSLLTESEEISFQEKALAFLTGFINPEETEILEINKKEEVKNEEAISNNNLYC
ncbi:MAG: hypothetical protein NC922_04005 [Candidatus Omnitrophica bacterium]|nr:hypothetical protein [Candidatus Omnitrophota bacterium]